MMYIQYFFTVPQRDRDWKTVWHLRCINTCQIPEIKGGSLKIYIGSPAFQRLLVVRRIDRSLPAHSDLSTALEISKICISGKGLIQFKAKSFVLVSVPRIRWW